MGNVEKSASVAILDSIYKPTKQFAANADIGFTRDFVNQRDTAETTGHGRTVVSFLAQAGKNIEYNFYRIVLDSGKIPQRSLLKAMGKAHLDHEVDVMNLSFGYDHSHNGISCDMPNEPCKVREAAKMAIEDGITIVAAAGNANDAEEGENDTAVCCPALLDEVITVGGMYVACTAVPKQGTAAPMPQTQRPLPPLSCWITRDNESEGMPICTGLDCSSVPSDECEDNQMILEWSWNVRHEPSEIDILAPVEYPVIGTDGRPRFTSGTSFGSPIVTGAVAEMIACLKSADKEPVPSQIQAAIANTGKEVDEGDGRYLQAYSALQRIADRKGIDISVPNKKTDFGM